MIEVKNLVKFYGKARVLDDINFKVSDGEILGFLGPNGAGKSTTMNIITGFLSYTSGSVKISDIDIFKKPLKAKKNIGYLPETPPLYQDMTVKAYLNFVFDLKKIKLNKEDHINEICETVGIKHVKDRVIKNLSKGYKQRVGLAQALVGYPEVLILDEPTVGLDPKQIIEIRNLIKSFAKKHTVILSSHVLPEVQAICDRILVINNGKIVADDTPDKLAKNVSSENRLRVVIDGSEDDALAAIKSIEEVIEVKKAKAEDENTCVFDVACKKDSDIKKQLAMAVNKTGAILLSANNIQMSLEDIFLKLTEDSKNQEGSEGAGEEAAAAGADKTTAQPAQVGEETAQTAEENSAAGDKTTEEAGQEPNEDINNAQATEATASGADETAAEPTAAENLDPAQTAEENSAAGDKTTEEADQEPNENINNAQANEATAGEGTAPGADENTDDAAQQGEDKTKEGEDQ